MSPAGVNDKQLRHFIASMPFAIKAYKYYLGTYTDLPDEQIEMQVAKYKKGMERYVSFVSSYNKAQSKERKNKTLSSV